MRFRFHYAIKWFHKDKIDTAYGNAYLVRDVNMDGIGCRIRVDRNEGFSCAFDGHDAFVTQPQTGEILQFDATMNSIEVIKSNLPTMDLIENTFGTVNRLKLDYENSDSSRYDGQLFYRGDSCDVITTFANPDGFARTTRWVVGRRDNLIRQWDEETHWMGRIQHKWLDISEIIVNNSINEKLFRMESSEGFSIHQVTLNDLKPSDVLAHGQLAPSWVLHNSNRQSVSLNDTQGKIRVLDFWGTWCGPCIAALPELQKLNEEYQDRDVVVYGITCKESEESDPHDMMMRKGAKYELLLEGDSVAVQYHVSMYPTIYVIGDSGEVIHVEEGFNPKERLATIRKIIDTYVSDRKR